MRPADSVVEPACDGRHEGRGLQGGRGRRGARGSNLSRDCGEGGGVARAARA